MTFAPWRYRIRVRWEILKFSRDLLRSKGTELDTPLVRVNEAIYWEVMAEILNAREGFIGSQRRQIHQG